MTTLPQRRWIRITIVVTLLVIGVVLGMRCLEGAVLARSERILAQFSGPGSRIQIGQVDLKLIPGDIRWTDLQIVQPAADPDTTMDDRSMRVSGRVDELSVRGLSLWRLLFAHTLSMRSITIINPDMEVILMNDTAGAPDRQAGSLNISAFNTDTIAVENGAYRMHRTGQDTTNITVDTMNLQVTGLRSRWGEAEPFELRFTGANGKLLGIHAALPPVYDLVVARVELENDGSVLQVTDATLKPLKGQQEYDKVVHTETDLFNVHLDTAMLDGLDLNALINARTLSTTTMRIAGVDLDVFRDKTMPDAPFEHKPMPARLVRELPIALCMDSLVVDRWNVHYHEKNTLSTDYGEVMISDIHGVVNGLCSADTLSSDTLVVRATAICYGQAKVNLDLRTVIGDSSDRFTVNAMIGGLPIEVFNRMTADLLLMRTTAGTIGGIDLTMNADDDRATGRVAMEYDGLKVELIRQDGSGETRKFMSGLMNQVVRSRNLRSDPGFRHGDFTIERRKDRQIFNYLWSGLREGMIITALPGVLETVRQMDKAGSKR